MRTAKKQEIRVLHVIETLDIGGAETVVANIVNHMSPGFHAGICCLMHSGPVSAHIHPGVEIIEMGKAVEGNDYGLPLRLAKILRSRSIDVVQSHDWGTLLETTAAATLAGVTAVHMAHGPSIHYPATDRWAPLKKNIRRKVERFASLKLDCAIAVSEAVRRELIDDVGIPARKVVLIHNGIDLTPVPLGDLTARRETLRLSSEEIVLVAVGRLAEIKNYNMLLEAFARAVKELPVLRLVMVGDGPERAKLEATAMHLGLSDRVHFLGARDDVREWLALSHVFVLPSLYEGISIALLEAMAAGLPAVATQVGGNPEVVTDQQNGILVESGDVEGFARALVVLARDEALRERMGRAARKRIEMKFDLNRSVRQYEEIYLRSAMRTDS